MAEPKVSRGKAKAALSALSRGKRDFGDLTLWDIFPKGINFIKRGGHDPEHDREMVISATAALEQALEEAILPKFTLRSDSDQMLFLDNAAPLLSDFYDKCRMAYLLGIVGKQTLHDLSIIRHVRNAFAHTRGHLDLDMPEFQNILEHLTAPERCPKIMEGRRAPDDMRDRFIQTCFQLAMYLAFNADPGDSDMWDGHETFLR